MPPAPAFAALAELSAGVVAPAAESLSDGELLAAQRRVAEVRRRVDGWAAALAAEIARRSRHELGGDGLAQRLGLRTPERLVQQLAGSSAREAHTLVRVGTLMTDAGSPLDAIGAAVASGRLPLDAAEAIRAGLDHVDPAVPPSVISDAAGALLHDATSLTVEKLASRARDYAAELDEQHVVDRERALRDARYLRLTPQPDGMTRLSGLLDPESAAIVVAAYDGATSPRRGGPRFVDPASIARAERLTHDERTTEQLALDAFVELIRIGSDSAPEVVGAQRPAVRVIVTQRDLARRAGSGRIEGQSAPISIATVEREVCDRGAIVVSLDRHGQPLDVGRDQRLFTRRQRVALAIRDGGCRFPGCDRPPSWCEAHHIIPWSHGGRTDVRDGVLLCRHHHLLLHDNGWRIGRRDAEYWLVPPTAVDPSQAPVAMPAKSRLLEGALAAG